MEMPLTGIGKATASLYEAVFGMRPDLEGIAVHRRRLHTKLDSRFASEGQVPWIPEKWWRRVTIPMIAKRSGASWIHFPWNGNVPVFKIPIHVVTTLHDVLPLTIPGYFTNSTEEMKYRTRIQDDIDRTQLLLTDSDFSKKEIMRNFKTHSEPTVLRLASTLKVDAQVQHVSDSSSGRYFFYVGGYDRRKGLDVLTRIFVRLHLAKKIQSKLVIAGDKKFISTEFERDLATLYDLNAVEEIGYITDQELARRFREAIALVYPSLYEGFGLPPLEAMSQGCPVITTRGTSIPEVCGDAAVYMDPADEKSLADSLLLVSSDHRQRLNLIEKGRKQAGQFSWSKTAQEFIHHLGLA